MSIANSRKLNKARARLGIRPARRLAPAGLYAAAFLAACLFFALLAVDIARTGIFFDGIEIAGVAVGGLNREQALLKLRERVTSTLERPFTLEHGDRRFRIGPEEIAFKVDEAGMLEAAYWEWRGKNVFERLARRLFGLELRKNVPVMVKYDRSALRRRISQIAAGLNREPSSAWIDISKGFPRIVRARFGLKVDEEATARDLERALPLKTRRIEIRAQTLEPKVTEDDIDKIVVVKLNEHKLYLYEKEYLLEVFTVAVGSPQYPTPTGKFYIRKKEKNPTWYPPQSDWARGQKPIPPGPGNPLGPYWMEIGNGIGIHSTPDEASLGYSVSHGCIRMSEWGAMQLFNAVKVGTPVFILP